MREVPHRKYTCCLVRRIMYTSTTRRRSFGRCGTSWGYLWRETEQRATLLTPTPIAGAATVLAFVRRALQMEQDAAVVKSIVPWPRRSVAQDMGDPQGDVKLKNFAANLGR